VRYTKAALTRENYPLLFDLWDRVSFHTRYAVSYEEATLVSKAIGFLKDKNHYPTVTRLTLQSNTAKIQMSGEGLLAQSTSNALRETQGKANAIPDVFGFIQSRIKLSRSSIAGLFKECGRIDELMINPQRFLEYVVAVFERAKNEILYEGGVKYEKGPAWDAGYTQKLFADELGEALQEQVLEVRPDFADKTAFNYYRTDSAIEDNFARDCEVSEVVKFFFKIPRGFEIPTPIGNYTPDWAVVLENDSKLYFVAETKGTLDPGKLRDEERFKIRMGGQFFSALQTDIGYKLAVKASDLIKSA
jgi:type III restriction enzyme